MFVNFSNHRVEYWTEKQKEEAIKIGGEIAEIAFPKVAPKATEEEIKQLADEYLKKIMDLNPDVVMCQGEFNLVFTVTNRLMDKGVRVVAATSERITEQKEVQRKTVEFRFEQFRDYVK